MGSKRYYATQVLGNGDDTERDENGYLADDRGSFRLSINNPQYVPLWKRVGTIQTGPTGVPLAPFQLCVVDAADHTTLRADPLLIAFPDVGGIDTKFESIAPDARNIVRDFIFLLRDQYGMNIGTQLLDGPTKTTVSYREVLQYVGQKLDATFNIERLEIA